MIIIILLQKCAFFYFWRPADVSHMQGSGGFCSLVAIFPDPVHPTFANLWQSRHILAHLFVSFSVLLFLSHQQLSVVPLLDAFLNLFSHMLQPSQPLLSQKLFQSLYTRHLTNLLIDYFILQGFTRYHLQHSHFCGLNFLSSFIFNARHSAP